MYKYTQIEYQEIHHDWPLLCEKLKHVHPIQNSACNLTCEDSAKWIYFFNKSFGSQKKTSELFNFFPTQPRNVCFFMGVDDFHQCICLSQAQQIQNPTSWVNPMIFCRPNIPNKYRSATHTHKKKCIFALAKPIFTAGVFGDPIPFSRQVLRTLHGSTRAGSITKRASFYNGFAEQPLYNQIV